MTNASITGNFLSAFGVSTRSRKRRWRKLKEKTNSSIKTNNTHKQTIYFKKENSLTNLSTRQNTKTQLYYYKNSILDHLQQCRNPCSVLFRTNSCNKKEANIYISCLYFVFCIVGNLEQYDPGNQLICCHPLISWSASSPLPRRTTSTITTTNNHHIFRFRRLVCLAPLQSCKK